MKTNEQYRQLQREVDELKAQNNAIKLAAAYALDDLCGLLNDQKQDRSDGSYKYDGQSACELGRFVDMEAVHCLAQVQAKAVKDAHDRTVTISGYCPSLSLKHVYESILTKAQESDT